MKIITPVLALGILALAGCAPPPKVSSEEGACQAVKARVVAVNPEAKPRIAFCDHLQGTDGPPDYFILALHSNRQCDGICSTNMGWFGVRKSTGEVFEWDVGESKPIGPVSR